MTDIASVIEHTILKPNCTLDEIRVLCEEAEKYHFAAVCVPPYFVRDAREILTEHTKVKVSTVIGFPMGYACIASKIEEIKRSIMEEADELDVVINIAAVKSKQWNHVRNDIDATVRAIHLHGKIAKLIIETGLLTNDEILKVCELGVSVGTNYFKTSTGFNGDGATLEAVTFLRKNTPKEIKIKASGGIQSYKDAAGMIEAGAARIGCSASLKIMSEQKI